MSLQKTTSSWFLWVNRQFFCLQSLALEPEEKGTERKCRREKSIKMIQKKVESVIFQSHVFPPTALYRISLLVGCMQTACWGMVEFDLFSLTNQQRSVQAFPSDSDAAQWRKQQGRWERNKRRALFQLKLLLWHPFEKDDVILCSFSKL